MSTFRLVNLTKVSTASFSRYISALEGLVVLKGPKCLFVVP